MQEMVKVQTVKIYLDVLHPSEILRNKFLDVSITRGIANFVLFAVENCLHADFAMIKSVIIQWIGEFLPFIVCLVTFWVDLYMLDVMLIQLQESYY